MLARVTRSISGATAGLALWWLLIAGTTPSRAEHRSFCLAASFPLLAAAVVLSGPLLRAKQQQTTVRDTRIYYRAYPILQLPPLRAFVALLALHLCYRIAALLDGGALSARLNPPPAPPGAQAPAPASALGVCVAVLAPSVLASGLVLPLLVALPMHAANERLGGFSELRQFQAYLGLAGVYAAGVGGLNAARWAAEARGAAGAHV